MVLGLLASSFVKPLPLPFGLNISYKRCFFFFLLFSDTLNFLSSYTGKYISSIYKDSDAALRAIIDDDSVLNKFSVDGVFIITDGSGATHFICALMRVASFDNIMNTAAKVTKKIKIAA